MDTNRCGSCGFLNFTDATTCKRCKVTLETSAGMGESSFFGGQAEAYPAGAQAATYYPGLAYQPNYFSSPVAALPQRSKHGGTNSLLLALLCGAVMVAAAIGVLWKFNKSASASFTWEEYRASDQSYSVLMPVKPVESVERLPTPAGLLEMHLSMADLKKNGAYLAAYIDYPASSLKALPQEVLDASAQGAVRNSRSTLVSKKNITLDGHPGVEIVMLPPADQAPEGGRAVARIYWVAPRLYMTFGGGPETSDLDVTLAKFHDSFRLLK